MRKKQKHDFEMEEISGINELHFQLLKLEATFNMLKKGTLEIKSEMTGRPLEEVEAEFQKDVEIQYNMIKMEQTLKNEVRRGLNEKNSQ